MNWLKDRIILRKFSSTSPVPFYEKEMLEGVHRCNGMWRVRAAFLYKTVDKCIQLQDLIPLLETKKTKLISHSDIAWKNMDNPTEIINNNLRYTQADIDCPCIIAEGVMNPFDKKYRMIDGSHRITKMQQENIT